MRTQLYTIFFILLSQSSILAQNFTNVAGALGVDLNAIKEGGHAWGDLNNDGCLDLIVNTSVNGIGTRVYFSNCDSNPDSITFSDVTLSHAAGLVGNRVDRSLILGDYNNDGYVDFARNTVGQIQIFINKGPTASPAYSFGDASQNPNLTIAGGDVPGINSEGMAWADVDGDGWLDLLFDNHGDGTEVLFKQSSGGTECGTTFSYVEGSTIGLPNVVGEGDYLAVGDINLDGFPDLLARKPLGASDLFLNQGNGTFAAVAAFDEEALNGDKGGVVMCDFDNDGDHDIFWSDADRNVIYENLGGNPISFTIHNEGPIGSGTGIQPAQDIDGCACGDVDLDGDLDLFLSSNNGSTQYLYRNELENGTPFHFSQNNGGISSAQDGESVALVDYDKDGDLDVSISYNNSPNELWRSDLITTTTPSSQYNFLKVKILLQNPLTLSGGLLGRDVIGATALLRRNGIIVGGLREVNGGRGHGSQDPAELHFGLPDGPNVLYDLEINFPSIHGNRYQTSLQVRPSDFSEQTVVIAQPAQSFGVNACNMIVALPVRLLSFQGRNREEGIELVWSSTSETPETRFILEKSRDGKEFTVLAEIPGKNQNSARNSYTYLDIKPQGTMVYYRLLMLDENEFAQYSAPIAISRDAPAFQVGLYPNPARSTFIVQDNQPEKQAFQLQAYDKQGMEVWREPLLFTQEAIQIPESLDPGMYTLRLIWEDRVEYQKLVIVLD